MLNVIFIIVWLLKFIKVGLVPLFEMQTYYIIVKRLTYNVFVLAATRNVCWNRNQLSVSTYVVGSNLLGTPSLYMEVAWLS